MYDTECSGYIDVAAVASKLRELSESFPEGRRRKLVSDIALAVADELLDKLIADVKADTYSTVFPWNPAEPPALTPSQIKLLRSIWTKRLPEGVSKQIAEEFGSQRNNEVINDLTVLKRNGLIRWHGFLIIGEWLITSKGVAVLEAIDESGP